MINLYDLQKTVWYADKIEMYFEGRGIHTMNDDERKAIVDALDCLAKERQSRE